MHSMVTITKILYYMLEVVKRVDLKCYHHAQKIQLCEGVEVLTNLIVVIILQYICVSNQHIVYFKLSKPCVNNVSIELGEQCKKKKTQLGKMGG